jgi:hypothetical protein
MASNLEETDEYGAYGNRNDGLFKSLFDYVVALTRNDD